MKKSMTNILVFPCGSEIGIEIYNSLSDIKNINLFGGSSVSNNPGKMYYERYFEGFPMVDDIDFINYLNDFIQKYNIDILYPAMDKVILNLSKQLDKVNCRVIIANEETVEICMSKSKSYKKFKNKIRVPKLIDINSNNNSFPLFVKPDIGHGSRGAKLIKSFKELDLIEQDMILMEYLPGKEYTIDCFTDFRGNLLFVGGRQRKRIVNGISASTELVNNSKFNEIAAIINRYLKFNGAWFFQLKVDSNGEFCLLEIAPRIAGVSGLYRIIGVNLPLLNIYNIFEIKVSIQKNDFMIESEKSLVSRYSIGIKYKKVYIDLDDTLIINNKVNLNAISFIYSCINNKYEVYLITRHRGDLTSYLEKFKLTNLFTDIIWIKNNSPKSKYIDKKDSIFIDDSYQEREDVLINCKIPVFDVSAIEGLLY
ncbi:ATP-grasp domain-containing protein [Lysinibacillus sp. RSDA_15]|uniref:ATP-grasp domain-containing protein n=1 Tax=Lysinibacillus TaxID=400634 RepID=UPI0018CE3E55|nr:ATP-grasp domain-containing protein [Lysinibacillus sphaericus]MBG9755292.1 hypothetical protein [Lysinibacillus sphaericus]QTB14227.1 ATP-grasp domain-containing protein [Lysinibacillus sphaericus]